MSSIRKILLSCCLASAVAGCSREYPLGVASRGAAAERAIVTMSMSATRGGVNLDTETWEDRVTEIRLIAFDGNGIPMINRMLDFPNGMNNPCEGVAMVPGVYDLCFIANETAGGNAFAGAIASVGSISGLQTEAAFRTLTYNPDFAPDGTTSEGRMVMSAIYGGVDVSEGGTYSNPLPLPLPTDGVELVRSLAKVQLIFRKKVSGGTVKEETIDSVQILNVARNYSVPPIDSYFRGVYTDSPVVQPRNFDYTADSMGSVVFYIPELLRPDRSLDNTAIYIDGKSYPISTDRAFAGLADQRRTVSLPLSRFSVIRNYDYRVDVNVNAEGGLELETSVVPWSKSAYAWMFQDPGKSLALPPVTNTPGGIQLPTSCGTIEMKSTTETLSSGLQGAYGDQILWYDPATQGPRIVPGAAPYYCEKKYGAGWRLISSCEMMSFLSIFDQAYRVWQSNTWQGINSGLQFYPAAFRLEAQDLLQKLTGYDMSAFKPSDSQVDSFGGEKLGLIDTYLTPGDVTPTTGDYPDGWPFPSPPATGIEPWFPMETVTQVRAYWYSGYLNYSDPANYDKILYEQFVRYNFSSTTSRCVRSVEQ